MKKNTHEDIWKIKIGDALYYILNNENAAKRLTMLIEKDINNYINARWRRLP